MQRLFTFALAMALVSASAVLIQQDMIQRVAAAQPVETVESTMANDAAFRDGLYLGKLARTTRAPTHPPLGRWSTEKDRASFVAGFRRGLNEPTK